MWIFIKKLRKRQNGIVDNAEVPLLILPCYIEQDDRNKIYSLYSREDIDLSLNSWKLYNQTTIKMWMKLIERQRDGNSLKDCVNSLFKLY